MTFAFDGEYSVEDRALSEAATDFGNLVSMRPRAVIRARSVQDVVRAVSLARQQKVPLVARGQGHTTRGQSLVTDGIVLDTRGLDHLELGSGWARVGAGLRWDVLLERTLANGQAPPTLTDYLGLSVGGTLSVGGVGGQSFRHGLQTDNVTELSVVTGAGEVLNCSRQEHRELFDACRAGLGQFGIIVAARLKLEPAAEEVTVYNVAYPDLHAFLSAQEQLTTSNDFDYVLGSVRPAVDHWEFDIELLRYSNRTDSEAEAMARLGVPAQRIKREQRPFFGYATRLRQMVLEMQQAGTWSSYHPWMDLFVLASSAEQIISAALELFSPRDLADGYVMTYPLRRSVLDTPCLGLPAEEKLYLFDLLPNIPIDGAPDLARFEAQCKSLYELAATLDARVYPIGYPIGAMSSLDWQRQLGQDFPRLQLAKRKFDPDGILGADLEIFPRHEGIAM